MTSSLTCLWKSLHLVLLLPGYKPIQHLKSSVCTQATALADWLIQQQPRSHTTTFVMVHEFSPHHCQISVVTAYFLRPIPVHTKVTEENNYPYWPITTSYNQAIFLYQNWYKYQTKLLYLMAYVWDVAVMRIQCPVCVTWKGSKCRANISWFTFLYYVPLKIYRAWNRIWAFPENTPL